MFHVTTADDERTGEADEPAGPGDPVDAELDDGGDGDGGPPDEEGDGGGGGGGGLSWSRVAVLGAALVFLGFAIGLVVTRDRGPSADSVDVGFAQDMITHHQQALGIANLEAAYGEDPVVRGFARDVLTFQSYEVGVMTEQLSAWGYTTTDRSDEAMGWMGTPVPLAEMPGLLTDDQIDEMGDARGADADHLFLEMMAEHHRGGLHMAQDAARRVDDDGLRALAQAMVRNQAQEINEYRLQADRGGYDLDIAPPPVSESEIEG